MSRQIFTGPFGFSVLFIILIVSLEASSRHAQVNTDASLKNFLNKYFQGYNSRPLRSYKLIGKGVTGPLDYRASLPFRHVVGPVKAVIPRMDKNNGLYSQQLGASPTSWRVSTKPYHHNSISPSFTALGRSGLNNADQEGKKEKVEEPKIITADSVSSKEKKEIKMSTSFSFN